MARNTDRLRGRPWYEQVEPDVADAEQIDAALAGADVAYHLVHALGTGPRFEARDRRNARIFGRAGRHAGVGRVVYLGGLIPSTGDLSPHLLPDRGR